MPVTPTQASAAGGPTCRRVGGAVSAAAAVRIGLVPTLPPPELAAWTMLSSTILNLDETVTKG